MSIFQDWANERYKEARDRFEEATRSGFKGWHGWKPKKFRIRPGQPINTSVFPEAIVLEENGVPTAAGLAEGAYIAIPEGQEKPIESFEPLIMYGIDFNTEPYMFIQQGGMGAGKTAAHTVFMESLKTGPDGQQ